MTEFTKGYVFVNGHNLGRYWNIGPQKSLYCPAAWLKEGSNEILVLEMSKRKFNGAAIWGTDISDRQIQDSNKTVNGDAAHRML